MRRCYCYGGLSGGAGGTRVAAAGLVRGPVQPRRGRQRVQSCGGWAAHRESQGQGPGGRRAALSGAQSPNSARRIAI
eukprot:scaffold160985_cov36-Prasinocladus_malaysianus.AAC.1